MYTKIEIKGTICVETGLHIGGSSAFAAIGAVDSPVVRDILSGSPMIPGSSLKGKMRTLLSKSMVGLVKNPNQDGESICRVFGSKDLHTRLFFSDSIMQNEKELKEIGVTSGTEVKFENTINRLSGVANPRQIERVIRGAEFPLSLMYEFVEDEIHTQEEILEDFKLIMQGLHLLELDYLGGSGSRGYGKVKFEDIEVKVVFGKPDEAIVEQCKEICANSLKEV